MTELNLIQFDITIYYINRYICRLHFITYMLTYYVNNTYMLTLIMCIHDIVAKDDITL